MYSHSNQEDRIPLKLLYIESLFSRSIIRKNVYVSHSICTGNSLPFSELVRFLGSELVMLLDTTANMNIQANDAHAEQAPAVTPPTKTDDQILPSRKWVPIGKSNFILDVQKSQRNPIFPIVLDEQWVNLHKDILRDALDITPTNDRNPYVAPPLSDILIQYVNTLGYPSTLRKMSAMSAKTSCALNSLRKNLATTSCGKKKTTHLLIPNVRFVGKDGREIFGMPIPDAFLIDEIKGAPYYGEYQERVAKYQIYLDAKHGKAEEEGATNAEDVSVEEPAYNEEEANLQWALELNLKEQAERTQGPARLMVIREPNSGRIQPLLDVQGKGKDKVVDEQAAHDLLTLLTPKNKSLVDQFIFQWRTPMLTKAFGLAESPSLDAKLALTYSEIESDN
nr:hypothetical protein [Tanacetum cinerariifolium]